MEDLAALTSVLTSGLTRTSKLPVYPESERRIYLFVLVIVLSELSTEFPCDNGFIFFRGGFLKTGSLVTWRNGKLRNLAADIFK